MAVRLRGRPVGPAAFRAPGPRLVVFVHGLMETEHAWRLGGRRSYGERLARDLGVTPLEVRYNSGRHISENGRSLAALLDGFLAAWPVAVREIALVGHSMGGLVARSACHQAAEERMGWVARVRHIVSLGSRIPLPPEHGFRLGGASHLALLNHPAVYAQLRAWLQAARSDRSSRTLPASPRTSGS